MVTSMSLWLPEEERDSLRHMIEEQSRENLSLPGSQLFVWLYDKLCLVVTIDANFL